jgi:hypothetical protein
LPGGAVPFVNVGGCLQAAQLAQLRETRPSPESPGLEAPSLAQSVVEGPRSRSPQQVRRLCTSLHFVLDARARGVRGQGVRCAVCPAGWGPWGFSCCFFSFPRVCFLSVPPPCLPPGWALAAGPTFSLDFPLTCSSCFVACTRGAGAAACSGGATQRGVPQHLQDAACPGHRWGNWGAFVCAGLPAGGHGAAGA